MPQRSRNRARGFEKERELARKLWEEGFACIRGPASGAKAKRLVQPDLVAARNGYVFVIEVKTRRKGRAIYLEKEQVEKLVEWARRAGPKAMPLVAVYVSKELGWRFVPVEKLVKTDSGNFKIEPKALPSCPDLLALKMLTEPVLRKLDSYREPYYH